MIDSVSDSVGAFADLRLSRRQKASRSDASSMLDKLPPYHLESEMAVIGCILLAARECYDEAKESLGSKEAFYDLRCQVLFENLDASCDSVVINKRLSDKGLLDQVGIGFPNECIDVVPSAANLPVYLEQVLSSWLARKLLSAATEISRKVYEYGGEVDQLLDEVERDILAIGESRRHLGFVDIEATLVKITDRVQRMTDSAAPIGMTTGFPALDAITGGYDAGLHIISGDRSVGKTSLAITIADYRIFSHNEKVCIISLETSAVPFLTRMICNRQRINSRAMRNDPTQEQLSSFSKGVATFRRVKDKVLLYEDSGMTASGIRAVCRRAKQQGATLFIVDFLQLIKSHDSRHNDTERVGNVVYEMKDMSKELNSPVLLLAGLSRSGELRSSGLADNAADTHLKLHKPKDGKRDDELWTVKCVVEKGKDVGEGDFHLDFYRPFFLYCPCQTKVDESDIP